jgi:hypothetical protein
MMAQIGQAAQRSREQAQARQHAAAAEQQTSTHRPGPTLPQTGPQPARSARAPNGPRCRCRSSRRPLLDPHGGESGNAGAG